MGRGRTPFVQDGGEFLEELGIKKKPCTFRRK